MKPGLGVGVLIVKENKILLGLRNPDKMKASSELQGQGTWTMPGGKVEFMETLVNAAKRELEEETNIKKKDIDLIHFMNLTYTKWNKELEVYYGILKNEVELIEEVNKLEWVSVNDNFFDMNRYAGEGNIGHIIEEIKIDLKSN